MSELSDEEIEARMKLVRDTKEKIVDEIIKKLRNLPPHWHAVKRGEAKYIAKLLENEYIKDLSWKHLVL